MTKKPQSSSYTRTNTQKYKYNTFKPHREKEVLVAKASCEFENQKTLWSKWEKREWLEERGKANKS